MLELRDVHTFLGESYILQGVSLRVSDGELVSLLGRNGVGKTTTIRSIIGFSPPRKGSILFKNTDVARLSPSRIARMGIGLVPQGRRVFPDLSVKENLIIGARGKGWNLERVFKQFPRLKEREKQKAGTLSGGEQQMLAIARALMTNPQLLLMDEPSEGLAPLIVKEIGQVLSELKQEGFAILLVEQNLSLAVGLADRAYVMNKGSIVFEGTPDILLHDEETKKQYLGV
ncbi:MAG: ABC transporter ATP-binding protein [Chloroflexi bacterium]|nr:ABC transporter ATP-binding protein [Chloroflexota bacterium]MDA8186816.1 ABC transporter ATP-binding protein [Dehalococcoidales bacterium]